MLAEGSLRPFGPFVGNSQETPFSETFKFGSYSPFGEDFSCKGVFTDLFRALLNNRNHHLILMGVKTVCQSIITVDNSCGLQWSRNLRCHWWSSFTSFVLVMPPLCTLNMDTMTAIVHLAGTLPICNVRRTCHDVCYHLDVTFQRFCLSCYCVS